MKTRMVLFVVFLFQFSCAPKYTASFHEYHHVSSGNDIVISSQSEEMNTEEISSIFPAKGIIASVYNHPTEFKRLIKIGISQSPVVKQDQVQIVKHTKKNEAKRKEFNQERKKWNVGDYVILILLIGLLAYLVLITITNFN